MSSSIGTVAEMKFRYECLRRNIVPSIPDADVNGYDAIVQGLSRLHRVQVKCTNNKVRKGYKVSVGRGSKGKRVYTKDDIDFFAIYIIERDIWYIIPIREIKVVCISLFPDNPKHKFNKYIHAWQHLAS